MMQPPLVSVNLPLLQTDSILLFMTMIRKTCHITPCGVL